MQNPSSVRCFNLDPRSLYTYLCASTLLSYDRLCLIAHLPVPHPVCLATPCRPLPDPRSREGSENSQDDERFKARREFLKSGLPESFKKQIARSAASRGVYSAACASFQAVVHVRQEPRGEPERRGTSPVGLNAV